MKVVEPPEKEPDLASLFLFVIRFLILSSIFLMGGWISVFAFWAAAVGAAVC